MIFSQFLEVHETSKAVGRYFSEMLKYLRNIENISGIMEISKILVLELLKNSPQMFRKFSVQTNITPI